MVIKVSSASLGVEIARAQHELRGDRVEMRSARASIAEARQRASVALNEAAFVVKAAEVIGARFGERLDGAEKEIAGEAGTFLQEGSALLRSDAGRIKNADAGDDFVARSSSKMTARLAKLLR